MSPYVYIYIYIIVSFLFIFQLLKDTDWSLKLGGQSRSYLNHFDTILVVLQLYNFTIDFRFQFLYKYFSHKCGLVVRATASHLFWG